MSIYVEVQSPTVAEGVMTMNRRRFLYTSVCTAGSFLSTSAQERVPAQSAPKTLLEYRGSNAAVDRFMRGATASRKTNAAVSAFIAAAKEKPSGRDSTNADLVILPDKRRTKN